MSKFCWIKKKTHWKYELPNNCVVETGIFFEEEIKTSYCVLYPDGLFNIYKGYAWNGASGPTFDTKNSMRGSCAHDALYQLMREGLLNIGNRNDADQLLYTLCVEDGMSKLRAGYWYWAVKNFAKKHTMPSKKKEKIICHERKE